MQASKSEAASPEDGPCGSGRAPPCKRPRQADDIINGLGDADVVGPQTAACRLIKGT